MRSFRIRDTVITDESDAYVVCEVGHNHNGSQEIALEMVRVAAECGANAVKLQKRSPGFYAKLRERGLLEYADLRERRELTEAQYWRVKACAHEHGLAFIVTAFDEEALEFVLRVGVDAIKAASGAIHKPALMWEMIKAGPPVIVSTGGCGARDIPLTLADHDGKFSILQCTSSYPCLDVALNLRVIETYRLLFPGVIIGLSSHSPHNRFEPVAYALGARIFEKHFTLSRALGAGDHPHSLDPDGLRDLVTTLRATKEALGDGIKRFLPCEEAGRLRLDLTYQPTEKAGIR